jgi:hypothetical protein
VPKSEVSRWFTGGREKLRVVDVESLIYLKQTQRAKDYPIIGELARRLPPDRELEVTTDVDRILELAPTYGEGSRRAAVKAVRAGAPREEIVSLLAREIDAMQRRDRDRLLPFQESAVPYIEAFRRLELGRLPAMEAHPRVVELAADLLPRQPEETHRADAQ